MKCVHFITNIHEMCSIIISYIQLGITTRLKNKTFFHIWSENLFVRKNFGCEKITGPKNILMEKFLGPKFLCQKTFGSKKIMAPKFF